MPKQKGETPSLRSWQQIATFLGQPISLAQRWAKSGMPVTRKGRYVYSSPEELNRWLGGESAGRPVRIATRESDLTGELKRGLSLARKSRRGKRKSAA